MKPKKHTQELLMSEAEYSDLLKTAKTQIDTSRSALALQVNSTANATYWNLGKLLYERKIVGGYGSNVIIRLSADLKNEYPEIGLSPRNLWNMKLFYERYKDADQKLLHAVAVLQWGHNLLIINKKLSNEETYYYARESVQKNWNRDLLLNAIKMNMFAEHKNELRDNNFIGGFKSEYAGKMNTYLSLLDKLEREKDENQSIGIILCAEKDHLDVEIALQDINKPIAVADYELIVPKQQLQALIVDELNKTNNI